MPPFDERPFRSEEESATEPADVNIRMGDPRVRPHVVPVSGKTGELTKHDFVTSFLVAWQPSPTPPAHWIELLREAPFGTQTIRARNLHWNGRSFRSSFSTSPTSKPSASRGPTGSLSPTPSSRGARTPERPKKASPDHSLTSAHNGKRS